MKKLLVTTLTLLALVGCTDADIGKLTSLGDSARVVCYSGGVPIYDGESTGKILSESQSDGYYFVDKRTRRTVEVSGDCVVEYK